MIAAHPDLHAGRRILLQLKNTGTWREHVARILDMTILTFLFTITCCLIPAFFSFEFAREQQMLLLIFLHVALVSCAFDTITRIPSDPLCTPLTPIATTSSVLVKNMLYQGVGVSVIGSCNATLVFTQSIPPCGDTSVHTGPRRRANPHIRLPRGSVLHDDRQHIAVWKRNMRCQMELLPSLRRLLCAESPLLSSTYQRRFATGCLRHNEKRFILHVHRDCAIYGCQ